jgi:hypothetical protein
VNNSVDNSNGYTNPTLVVTKCTGGLNDWDASVSEVLGYEENIHGEDVVTFKCKLCKGRHSSRIHLLTR